MRGRCALYRPLHPAARSVVRTVWIQKYWLSRWQRVFPAKAHLITKTLPGRPHPAHLWDEMPGKPKPEAKVSIAADSTTNAQPNDGLPVYFFASLTDFETFLEQNHSTLQGLHLKLAKKASGVKSIAGPEAVEVALCFGWIDGRANRLDDDYWLVRYTPRRAKSIWSQKNVCTVTRLIEEGKMRESGFKEVEAAKQDGRWERAYAGPATIQVPEDLAARLEEAPSAKAFFAGLTKSERYSVLWRIETCSPQNRPKRIDAMVQTLAAGTVPGASAKVIANPDKSKIRKPKVEKRTIMRHGRRK